MKVGDKVRVNKNVAHRGKVGVVEEIFDSGLLGVRFSGDQRVWLDEGETYELAYDFEDVELVDN